VLHCRVGAISVLLLLVSAGAVSGQAVGDPPSSSAAAADRQASDALTTPSLTLRGFGDVQFRAGDSSPSTSTFGLGQLDLFITSTLGETFSVLAESVVEAADDNTFGFEIERLQLQYNPNDRLKLILGRYHTNIGYYNTAYHHGTWFQTAVGRPTLFAFEDEHGILPIHEIGFSASGRISPGAIGLHYVVEVGNGRDWRPDAEPVQTVEDHDSGKAANVGFYVRPNRWAGFQAGASVYRDRLKTDSAPDTTETLLSAHAVYERPDFEFLNEFVLLRFRPRAGPVFQSPAFYSQIAKRIRQIKPYVRYEFIDVDPGTPFIADVGRQHGPSIGVRYEAGPFVALKGQFNHVARRGLASANTVTFQAAFTF
jgi:hypothetical protein